MSEVWVAAVYHQQELAGYEVSNHGRVRDSRGQLAEQISGCPKPPSRVKEHRVSPPRVRINTEDGRSFLAPIHHLVLESFVGPRPADYEACHYDDNPLNNTLSNLRWDTRSANMADRVRNRIWHQSIKTHCPRGHEYTVENTVRSDGGRSRSCRTCRSERSKLAAELKKQGQIRCPVAGCENKPWGVGMCRSHRSDQARKAAATVRSGELGG